MKDTTPLRTPKEARAWLAAHGVTVCEFARRAKLPRWAVDDALRGRSKGHWGKSHEAAVKLGLKPAPKGEPPFSLDTTHAAQAA